MSNLRLRIDKYLEGDESRPPKVFAKIYSLGSSGAQRQSKSTATQAMIPISHLPAHAASVDLAPGRYYVEAVLPSGEILADDVVLSGPTEELVLRADDSPREWLSWQHLVGNVPTSAPIPRVESFPTESPRAKVRKKAKAPKGGGKGAKKKRSRKSGAGVAEAFTGGEETFVTTPAEVNLAEPIVCLSHPFKPLVDYNAGHIAWPWLTNLSAPDPSALISALNQNQAPFNVSATVSDEAHAVFRIGWTATPQSGVKSLKNHIAKTPRCFAVVRRRRSVELVSLPIPWTVVDTQREADIEVVVQEPANPTGFCSSAVARDEELGMLLGYLSSGSLPTAREMVETAKGLLYEKFLNPFAAAAGGYGLVGTALHASDREWHDWVRNLMNSFPHIPDGAIQWGQLKIRMRRSTSDIDEARKAFKLAYSRGLPFYSLGMRWLLDGLESVSHNDPEAEDMVKNVRRLAWRTNYQQPFTIIRLGD